MTKQAESKQSLPKTIDEVLIALDQIVADSVSSDNYLCLFALVYRDTTAEIKAAIEAKKFEDPDRMEKMDVIFANLYIQAYRDYAKGLTVSESWKSAFKSAKSNLAIVQHIMLGMNAHINLDLSVAAASVVSGAKILDLKHDFMVVNEILASLTNKMQRGLGKVSLMMKLLDIFGYQKDEKIINFSIARARDFAWQNTMELALTAENMKKARVAEIDKNVAALSRHLKEPPGRLLPLLLKGISLFEQKDPAKIIEKMKSA